MKIINYIVVAMLFKRVVEVVRSVIGDASPEDPMALHEPLMIGNEQKYVSQAISSGWVAQGDYIERFERMICDATGASHAVAVCSGTCALEVAFAYFYGHGWTKASIPSLTFVATANAARHANCSVTLQEEASIPVHLLGHNAENGYGFVRDAAQAMGSDIPIHGALCYSFNGNKIITTGGGGAIVTNDDHLAGHVRHMISTARVPHDYMVQHDAVAWNYRMPNINAALGCAQMEQLPYILKAKRALAQKYVEAFDAIDGVTVWKEPEDTRSNYWLVAIILDDPAMQAPVIRSLHDAGYMARLLPTPLHMLPMYKDCPRGDMTRTEDLWRRTICLPSSPKLGVKYA